MESNYRFDVKISKKYYGSIIGKGGVTLRKIREDTNTKIEMPKEDSELDIITIIGKKENVDKARKRLQEIEKQVVCMYVYIYVYMYICMYVCNTMYVCMYVHVCMYMYVCMYVHVCMYMYVCVIVCTCIYVHVCTCMYIYITIYVHVQ